MATRKPSVTDAISAAVVSRGLAKQKTMKLHQIRMLDQHWTILAAHFKGQGISTSAGIRQVLLRYMQDQRIR